MENQTLPRFSLRGLFYASTLVASLALIAIGRTASGITLIVLSSYLYQDWGDVSWRQKREHEQSYPKEMAACMIMLLWGIYMCSTTGGRSWREGHDMIAISIGLLLVATAKKLRSRPNP